MLLLLPGREGGGGWEALLPPPPPCPPPEFENPGTPTSCPQCSALNTLDKNSLTELKSMGKPPDDVVMVVAAVLVLTADPKKIPKDRSWASCKKMMANVSQWLKDLLSFDQNNIPQVIVCHWACLPRVPWLCACDLLARVLVRVHPCGSASGCLRTTCAVLSCFVCLCVCVCVYCLSPKCVCIGPLIRADIRGMG